MKQLYSFIAFFLILSVSAKDVRAQSGFSPEAYMDFRKGHLNYMAEEIIKDHPPATTYYASRQDPADLSAIPWYDSINKYFVLTADEKAMLEENFFMVTERLHTQDWVSGLLKVYSNDLPLFLSSDFILGTLHSSYDAILMELEWQFLEPNLKELLHAMHSQLPEVAGQYAGDERFVDPVRDADLFIAVALSLAEAEEYPPHFESLEKFREVLAAIEAEDPASMPLFTGPERERKLDFSQFTPRGHYTKEIHTAEGIRTLEDYFRSMMWLGRIDFMLTAPPADGEPEWTAEELRRMQVGALLVNETLYTCGKLDNLQRHEEIITFMVGPDDNLSPWELKDLSGAELSSPASLFDESVFEAFSDALNGSDDYGQKIMSNFFYVDPFSQEPDNLPISYRLLGQKFLLDSYVFAEVVFDRIIYEDEKIWRPLPDPLDAMAALGNEDALALLEGEMSDYKYAANMAGLIYLIESYDEPFWEQSMYNSWLDAIRSLNPPTSAEGLPYFMQTTAWHHEKLNTQLTTWAQLRHDNLLYGKQSYTGGISCSFPYTYVEPYPDFYARLADFADMAAAFFRQLPETVASKSRIVTYYERYTGIMDQLETVARKELDSEALSEDEIAFLKSMISEYMAGCGIMIDGWFNHLYYDMSKAMEADFTVADVHTQPTDQFGNPVWNILHVGNGMIDMGVFLIENPCQPGHPMAFAGPVSSFHQEVQANARRLTDQDWEKYFLEGGPVPGRPDWVASYLLDSKGKSYPEGRSLKGSVYTGTGDMDVARLSLMDYLLVYPNPASHSAALSFVLNREGDLRLEVFDTSGRKVYQDLYRGMPAAEHYISLPVTDWPQGLYMLKVGIGSTSLVRELVIR